MWWVMIWVLILVGSGVYLAMALWGLWGQTKDLGSELMTAQERLDTVQGQLDLLGERVGATEELAVFADPAATRKKRDRAKADARKVRRLRRASTRPAWVKHVD